METMENEQWTSDKISAVDLVKVRELILAANPNVVPEMVAGDSFDGLMASVEPAKAAYERIASAFSSQQSQSQSSAASVAGVGSGGAPGRTFMINIEELSPSAKIAEGLRQRSKRS